MARSPLKVFEIFLLTQERNTNPPVKKSIYTPTSASMSRRWFLFLFVLVTTASFFIAPVLAQMKKGDDPSAQRIHGLPGKAEPSPPAVSSLKRLKEEHGGGWRVQWSDKTGRARMMFGDKTRSYPGSAKTAAIGFLEDYMPLFFAEEVVQKQDPPNLATAKEKKTLKGTVVTFQQTVSGLKVVDGFVDILVNEEGCIENVTSTAADITDIDTSSPALTGNDAFVALGQALEASQSITLLQPPELVIWAKTNPVLAYDIRVSRKESWNIWLHYVDASTGEVLESKRLVADKKPNKSRETDSTSEYMEAGTVLIEEGFKQGIPGANPSEGDGNQKQGAIDSSMEEVTPANKSEGDYGQSKEADDKRRAIQ